MSNRPMNGRSRTAGDKKKKVERYDFRQPKLFSKEIIRSLRSIHDVLARNLSRVFSSALRGKVDVYLQHIDQIPTSTFGGQIESPSVIYVLSFKNFEGEIIVVMPTDFSLFLIERQSGGRIADFPEKRVLTMIEEKIINRIMKSVNQEILTAWEPTIQFEFERAIYESKPENIHQVSLDPAIVAHLTVEMEGREAEIMVSYQYSLLKEVINDSMANKEHHAKQESLSGEALELYQRTLLDAEVSLQPRLGSTRLKLRDILRLEDGDVIPLNQKTVEPLSVHINGVKKMTAYPGIVQGRKAVRIFEIVEAINEKELL